MHASRATIYLSDAITIENKGHCPGSPPLSVWLPVGMVQSQKHFNDNAISWEYSLSSNNKQPSNLIIH